jgi:hypothetical protein
LPVIWRHSQDHNMLLRRFAVVKLWPELKVAEDECIARLKRAASSLGLECLEVDSFARLVDPPHTQLTSADVDFVISLHFETPKCYDIFSFVALWNPLQFFHEWGYRRCTRHLMTHDDFLSCSSQWADDHVRRNLVSDPKRDGPQFKLYHSLSGTLLKPTLGERKVFYAGINWERLRNRQGRHHELFKLLDGSGDLRVYGPKLFNGVDVWAGFSSYAGPVPFDGVSIVRLIQEAGIALVLSSPAHRESELMSSRLFESLAGGAVVICDENPFGRRFFGDSLLYINTAAGPEDTYAQIRRHVEWIRAEPEKALELATRAQEIFRRDFTLDQCLTKIYEGLPARKEKLAALYRPRHAEKTTMVCFLLPDPDPAVLERHITNWRKQSNVCMRPIFLLDREVSVEFQERVQASLVKAGVPGAIELICFSRGQVNGTVRLRLGDIIHKMIEQCGQEEYFCVVAPNESMFSDHLGSLVRALEDCTEAGAAWSDMLLFHKSDGRDLADVSEAPQFAVWSSNRPVGYGRFLFRTSAIRTDLQTVLPYLDELAMHLLGAGVKIVPTKRCTLTHDIQDSFNLRCSREQTDKEYELIRDYSPGIFDAGRTSIGYSDTLMPAALSLERMGPDAKTKLAVELAHSVPIPDLVKKVAIGLYRLWLHKLWRRMG